MALKETSPERFRAKVMPVILGQRDRNASDVVLSPACPEFAAIIFEGETPRFYDLHQDGLYKVLHGDSSEPENQPFDLDGLTAMAKVPLHGAISGAAFRPGKEKPTEVAVICNGGDDIWRFQLQTGKRLPPLWMDRPVRLAYSQDGRYLLGGGLTGALSVFDLSPRRGPEEVLMSRLPGEIRGLAMDYQDQLVYATTEYNSAVRLSLSNPDSYTRIHLRDESNRAGKSFKLYAVACARQSPLTVLGGVTDEFWLANPETGRGRILRSISGGPIRHAEFSNPGEILLLGEAGVELWRFDADQSNSVLRVDPLQTVLNAEAGQILAARRYGDTLFTFAMPL